MEVINALNATIDEEKQKNTDLERKIIDLKQENVNLTQVKKALLDEKGVLEYSIVEVEMRARMELMIEYKAGKHVD